MSLLTAGSLYVASHILRAARLQAFFVFDRPRLSRTLMIHFTTALVSLIVPFKMGELVRFSAFTRAVPSVQVGVAAFILEKFLDAVVLGLLIIALGGLRLRNELISLVIVLGITLIGFLSIHAFSSGASYTARRIFVERSESTRSLWLLRAINHVDRVHDSIKRVASGRVPFLISITSIIWYLDFMAFCALTSSQEFTKSGAVFAAGLGTILDLEAPKMPAWRQYSSMALWLLTATSAISVAFFLKFNGSLSSRKNELTATRNTNKRYRLEDDT